MTPADQRHTTMVIRDHFSDIDEDDQESEAASQSPDVGLGDEAHPRTDDASVTHDMRDDAAVDTTTVAVAAPIADTGATFGAADPHRGTRAGGDLVSHLSMTAPPTAGDATEIAAPAATHLAAPFPPHRTGGTADCATATAASTADTSEDADTDPNPAVTTPPAAEHICSFLLHIRRCADDEAAGLVVGAAPPDTGAGVDVDTAPGAAVLGVAADPTTSVDVDNADDLFADVDDFDPTSVWDDDNEITTAIPVLGSAAVPAGASQPPPPTNTCMDISAVATSSVTAARKRKRRSKHSHVAQDACKRQRAAAFLLTTQGNTDTGT